MRRILIIVTAGVAALALCSCSESQEQATRHNRSLGGTPEGAPLARGTTDPGILSDAAQYQPAKVPGGSAGGPAAAGKGAEASGDAETQVRAALDALLKALGEGQVEVALKLFDAEHVGPLLADKARLDAIFPTFDKLDELQKSVTSKLDPALAAQVAGSLGAGVPAAMFKVDVLDGAHATVLPNITALIFGPTAGSSALAVAKQADGWRFQLASPLTAEGAAEVVAYHKALQGSLDKLIEWIRTSEEVNLMQLQTMALQLLAGQPIEVPAVESQPAAAEPPVEEEPAPAAEPPPAEEPPPSEEPGTPASPDNAL